MLDIEVIEETTQTAFDIVSVDEMARHLRLSPRQAENLTWRANIEDALRETVDDLDFPQGKLNRCIRPRTLRRYLTKFPAKKNGVEGFISLPFPPFTQMVGISAGDHDDPDAIVPPSAYKVAGGGLICEIYPGSSGWPYLSAEARGVAVTYRAGYTVYPDKLKRLVKILAAHALENIEATINEPRQMAIQRKTDFGVDWLMASLRIPVSYDDWL